MNFREYQVAAKKTAVYPNKQSLIYPTIGLAGEVGEFSNKVKKILRGDYDISSIAPDLGSELGDILWYVSQLATDLGLSLNQIALDNTRKLAKRMKEGKIQGSGDNR